jgi:putative ABC transport system permease protein
MMATIFRDIRYGLRMLVRQPLFTLVALLTLAVGIGANITIFHYVNAFLLRPLPYLEADRLVRIRSSNRSFGPMSIAYPNFQDWQKLNQTFEAMACYRTNGLNLTGTNQTEHLRVIEASAELLPMLGTKPLLGRLFDPNDDRRQAQRTTILSHGLWQRCFNGDPRIVGQSLLLDGDPYTIIGVLPRDFHFPPLQMDSVALWTPIGLLQKYDWFMNRHMHPGINGIGKLKPSVTIVQAQADMERVAIQLEKEYPNYNTGNTVQVHDYHATLVRNIRPGIMVLMIAVGCVLLIVCVNIAGLLLVRAAARTQEFSVRCALGAGRLRIIQQLIGENLTLAVMGGIAGVVLARWGIDLLMIVLGDNFELSQARTVIFDRTMIGFILCITLVTALLFSLFPALQASLVTVSTVIRGGTRTATVSRRQHRLRDTLVVAEIAVALVLLTGAGLLLRSFQHYLKTDPGYSPDSTLTMKLSLPEKIYDKDQKKYAFYRNLLEKVKLLPSVKHAGLCSNLLGNWQSSYSVEGAPPTEPGQVPYAECCNISPDFIKAMGMRLIAGRVITEQDNEDAQRVALVDERFVHRWRSYGDPLGKRVKIGGSWFEVVGVVSHVKHYGIDRDSRESIYLSVYHRAFDYPTLVVRCQGDPLRLLDPIRGVITEIDPDLAPRNVQTLQAIMDEQSFMRRFITSVLGIFACAALLLSTMGLYGVTAYAVSQRTQEFGIRMALGAGWPDILRLVLGRGGRLILIGIGIGLVASLGLSRLIQGMLFGVTVWDPVTFLIVTTTLATIAIIACYIPARRAAKIDPMEALRYE